MRGHFLLALLFLAATGGAGAQTTDQFWGMTSAGGTDNAGTIFSTSNDGTGLTVRHQFPYTTTGPMMGGTRFTELGGKLYGIGEYGGKRDYVLFSYDPATGTVARLHDFELATGTYPLAGLTVFNGKLYGTTYSGGTTNVNDIAGTIFEYEPATSTYTKKHTFTFFNGTRPQTALAVYDNKLWGTTSEGGWQNSGTLFSYDPATSALSVKDTFTTATGKGSTAVTVFSGKLYGGFAQGGTANMGGVWCYDPAVSGSLAIVAPATSASGFPGTTLIPYGSKLYCTAPYGGASSRGTLLSFDPATNGLAVLHTFAVNGGANPLAELCATDGRLWSVTAQGGTPSPLGNQPGVIYSWDTLAGAFTKHYEAVYSDANATALNGRYPNAALTLYNGTLWSTMQSGGTSRRGVLYQYNPATLVFTKMKDLGVSEGGMPMGNLLYHNSKFYGYTTVGGANGLGVLFEFNPVGDVFTKLYDFSYATVYSPTSTPVVKNGVLYGVADGAYYNGSSSQDFVAVFSYNLSSGAFTTYNMLPSGTGWDPKDRLVEEPSGTFLGIASLGPNSSSGVGCVFRFNPSTGTITSLQSFALASGSFPNGISAYNGKYYITFSNGGTASAGSIMEFTPGVGGFQRGVLSASTTGRSAIGEVVEYGGKLWGMAAFDGGAQNLGTIFEFNPLSPYTVTKKYNFTLLGGNGVSGTLLPYNNKFYGLTYGGGAAGYTGVGVLFEFDPAASTYTKKTEFVFTNGASPYNSLISAPTASTPLSAQALNFSAEAVGGKAVLRWHRADEKIARYVVERSTDAATFASLGSALGGASGDCSFVDAAPVSGRNFYRLRLEEASGAAAYSEIKRLDFSEGATSVRLLNTAAMGGKMGVETSASGDLRIMSAMGAEVARMPVESGVTWVDVGGLAAGVYGVTMDGKWVGRFAVAR